VRTAEGLACSPRTAARHFVGVSAAVWAVSLFQMGKENENAAPVVVVPVLSWGLAGTGESCTVYCAARVCSLTDLLSIDSADALNTLAASLSSPITCDFTGPAQGSADIPPLPPSWALGLPSYFNGFCYYPDQANSATWLIPAQCDAAPLGSYQRLCPCI
jgi:hypothetical protein